MIASVINFGLPGAFIVIAGCHPERRPIQGDFRYSTFLVCHEFPQFFVNSLQLEGVGVSELLSPYGMTIALHATILQTG